MRSVSPRILPSTDLSQQPFSEKPPFLRKALLCRMHPYYYWLVTTHLCDTAVSFPRSACIKCKKKNISIFIRTFGTIVSAYPITNHISIWQDSWNPFVILLHLKTAKWFNICIPHGAYLFHEFLYFFSTVHRLRIFYDVGLIIIASVLQKSRYTRSVGKIV